jgi:ribosomal protein L11 methyltransferase
MKHDPLWQISIETSPEAEEAVAHLLEAIFQSPCSTYATEQSTRVTLFSSKPVTQQQAIRRGLAFITECGLNPSPATVTISKVPAQDWSESWKKHFKPIAIGKSLLIKPSWSGKQPLKNQAIVTLDPGLSFGTGQHPTTRFCLEELVRFRNPSLSQSLLDIGAGSGIIAISAAKLGYHPVVAFDIDPVAVHIAQANARRNRVTNQIEISRQDLNALPLQSSEKYEIICANLIDELLIQHAKRFRNRLRPRALLVIAGILATQFPAVQYAFQKIGLDLAQTRRENEWQSASFIEKKHKKT